MGFYSEPAFFLIVALLLIPAVVLGFMGRRSREYGLAVSVIMLALLFFQDMEGALAFGVFLVVSCATAFFTLWLFQPGGAQPAGAHVAATEKPQPHPHAVGLYRVALFVCLLPLICAKVSGVFDTNILGFLGISYLTFKSVQVLIEIRDGMIKELSFIDYLYFLLFFPVFTSGPIMRSRDFVAQMAKPLAREEYTALLADGAAWFVRGAVYKFVLGSFFQWLQWFAPSYIGTDGAGMFALGQLAQGGCYGMYLFFDFAGYSLMAMGIGAALGVRVPANFNAPFMAIDIKDFWNRWHITLSFWLRDYVFMRLTRSFMRAKTFKSRVTTACTSYIINMFVMGVWHGLTPDYIIYGIYHGLLLAGCELMQKKSKFYKAHKKDAWFQVASWAVTMIAVFFGFALFSGQVTTLVMGV